MKPGNLVTVRLLPGNKPGLFWLRPHTAELLLHFLIHFSTWSLENPPSKSQSVYTHTHTHTHTHTRSLWQRINTGRSATYSSVDRYIAIDSEGSHHTIHCVKAPVSHTVNQYKTARRARSEPTRRAVTRDEWTPALLLAVTATEGLSARMIINNTRPSVLSSSWN